MAEALISVLLDQLASIIRQQAEQEVKLVVGVNKEVGKLTSTLQTIKAVLEDAERRQVKEATVKQWLAKLKDVSYDMDDVLDEWNTAILKMKIEGDENAPRPKGKVCSFIPSCFCYRQVAQRRDIAIKIKELNETLDVIVNEKRNFDFTLLRGNEALERRPITDSFIDVSKVHGRDQDKNTLVGMLLSESSQGPTLRIISIVGMGGIGKTTLAQLVYNDDTVKAHFQKRIWVCVSDPFDEIRIAKAIVESLTETASNLNELGSLLKRIRDLIEDKKFLLVLDDVWTEDNKNFEQLKNCLKCGSSRSRILVTTRKENVANIMGTINKDMFRLGILSKKDCWSLFSQVAFFERPREECEKLEGIGGKIVDKCKGLPLAAKTLGSLLRFKKTREQWQSVLDNEVWKLEEVEKGLFPPLLLSYYDISFTMRRCFSYCAIFLKDYKLEKDKLICLWMAQGYLKEAEEMEMIGEECFENLAMRSFFQDFEINENGSIIRCKMHDIVHDFAQFLTKNECLVMEVSSSQEPMIESSCEKARHLMIKLAEEFSIPISIYNVKNLRSLIVESKASPTNELGLPKLFDQLTCLRALDFRWDGLKELPNEVGKLIHLRYLNLAGSSELEALPEIVCELCNLQILNVAKCYRLIRLPRGLGKLINLRHLRILNTLIKFMPKGIERLTCLRSLDKFVVRNDYNDGEASPLEGLKNLNHLRGRFLIEGLGNVRAVDEIKKAQFENKEHLICLGLKFREWRDELDGRLINDEQVIEAIEPPPNLEQLEIFYYRGTSVFPNWMMSLSNLKKVTINTCWGCEFLPPLGKLWSLESLIIEDLERVKRVGIEFLGIESEVNKNDKNEDPSKKDEPKTSSSSVIAFPKLQELYFNCMSQWEVWDYGMRRGMGEEEEEEDITTATTILIMPCLRSLNFKYCLKLKALPCHLPHSTSLERLEIYKCPILEERYYKKRKGEDWPKISHIPNIIINLDDAQKRRPFAGETRDSKLEIYGSPILEEHYDM